MAKRAAEFLETGGFPELLSRATVIRRLHDEVHVREESDATFKITSRLLPYGCQAKFAVLAYGVAVLATMGSEHILSDFQWTFVGGDHAIEGGSCLLRWGLGLRL